jgi:hypothetical protein
MAGSLLIPGLVCKHGEDPSNVITWIRPYAAGGNIGADAITKAPPDDYTIGMGNFAPPANSSKACSPAAARRLGDGRSRFSGRRNAGLAGHRRPQRPAGGDHRVAPQDGSPATAGTASSLLRGALS